MYEYILHGENSVKAQQSNILKCVFSRFKKILAKMVFCNLSSNAGYSSWK